MLVLLMLAVDVLLLLLLNCLPTWFNPSLLYLIKPKESVPPPPPREPLTRQHTIEAYRMQRLCPFFQGRGTSQSLERPFLSLQKAFPTVLVTCE